MSGSDKPKDLWDKIGVVLHPLGGLLTALAVTYVGIKGSQLLERRQSIDTNARLYSELMSRREEAESSLRKDMLVSIIDSFLRPAEGDLDAKVLNLELLAYNFHDSLDLRPLFLDLQRRIHASTRPDKGELLSRINGVAREITDKQIFAIEGHGAGFRRTVDLEELAKAGKAGIALDPEHLVLRGTSCDVSLRALGVDPVRQQLAVRLEVSSTDAAGNALDTRATFDVGFFDFPMIDNTRLAGGLRCAVTLANFSPGVAADLRTVCFPGEYASLKDRPYYDEVIQKLQQAAREAEDAAAAPAALP